MINQTSKVFFIITIFLGFSIVVLIFTHDSVNINESLDKKEDKVEVVDTSKLIETDEYLIYIKPLLNSVIDDSSSENITRIKNELYDYTTSDKYAGTAHINLYLAFETWEEYLKVPKDYLKNNIKDKLNIVFEIIPELDIEINKLKEIIE